MVQHGVQPELTGSTDMLKFMEDALREVLQGECGSLRDAASVNMTVTLVCSWSKHKAVLTCKPELSWIDSDSRQLHYPMPTGSRSIKC